MNNMYIKRCHSSQSTLSTDIIIMTFNILLGWQLKASLTPRGSTPKSFMLGGSAPQPNPLTFNILFLYPFQIPSIDKWYSFHIPTCTLYLRPLHPFTCYKHTVSLYRPLYGLPPPSKALTREQKQLWGI